ncbi:hypothetical protein [Massilia timonae]|uniref:hypothetical protein n=2 Tax=Telluria group TaxID=2895353 RepID=UPI0012F9679F|nr:hypothetical protein [Massilia timonae]
MEDAEKNPDRVDGFRVRHDTSVEAVDQSSRRCEVVFIGNAAHAASPVAPPGHRPGAHAIRPGFTGGIAISFQHRLAKLQALSSSSIAAFEGRRTLRSMF